MRIEFKFRYCRGNTWPELEFNSGSLINVTTTELSEFDRHITAIFDSTTPGFEITRKNKQNNDTIVKHGKIIRDQVIHVESIWVDDILLDLELIQPSCLFTPTYSQGYLDWCKLNNVVPPQSTNSLSWYFNGTFKFNYMLPFWQWYAELKKSQVSKIFSQQHIEMYFGTNHNEHQELLDQLKQLVKLSV